MDFYKLSQGEDIIATPYGMKTGDGEWVEGYLSVAFLNANFSQCTTAEEMKAATTSEGLKLFFDYLVSMEKLS